jgi:hypothetical protein
MAIPVTPSHMRCIEEAQVLPGLGCSSSSYDLPMYFIYSFLRMSYPSLLQDFVANLSYLLQDPILIHMLLRYLRKSTAEEINIEKLDSTPFHQEYSSKNK